MNHDEHLDNILDEALSEYREAEPLAGLEDRVLRRLQGREPLPARKLLRWGFTVPCLAALAIVIWIGMTRRTQPTSTPTRVVAAQPQAITPRQNDTTQADSPAALSQITPARVAVPRPAISASAALAHASAPTASVFPVPVPLTDQERAFVAAVGQHPEALRATPPLDAVPVIAQIEIKPLSTDETPGDNQ